MKDIYEKLYQLQEAYNSHTNITSINSKEDYYIKHIQDSLALVAVLPTGPLKLIDVGSGGGYPGLPIAIERPDIKVTLLDSIQKKTNYLEATIRELNLDNAEVITVRAETLGQDRTYREKYDVATARAVADINVLLELLSPLVKINGLIILMKSKNILNEITQAKNAEKILGLTLEKTNNYFLDQLERTIIVYKKLHPAPSKYPRKIGMPNKSPL